MFIVLLTYKKPLDVVELFVGSHRAYLDEAYKKDYLIASGPQVPRTGGVLLSQLKDRHQLQQVLDNDPFVLNDIVDYQMIEFTPVKFHQEFQNFI
jgi:uncharacterized protein YciI